MKLNFLNQELYYGKFLEARNRTTQLSGDSTCCSKFGRQYNKNSYIFQLHFCPLISVVIIFL